MKSLTLDASAIGAALFREPEADAAKQVLKSGVPLLVPDLLFAEVGNIAWKRHSRGEMDRSDCIEMLSELRQLPLIDTPSIELVEEAFRLALLLQHAMYDCIYLALAVRRNAVLVSNDRKFVARLSASPLKDYACLIADFAA